MGSGHSGDPEFRRDFRLVDGNLAELSGFLVEFDREGTGVSSIEEVTHLTVLISTSPPKYRERSQKCVPCSMTGPMSMALFHQAGLAMASYAADWVSQVRMVTHVSRIGRHDGEVVVVNDLLHLLHTSEVSQHVPDRHDVAILDELLGDRLGCLDRTSADGLRSALPHAQLTFSIK